MCWPIDALLAEELLRAQGVEREKRGERLSAREEESDQTKELVPA